MAESESDLVKLYELGYPLMKTSFFAALAMVLMFVAIVITPMKYLRPFSPILSFLWQNLVLVVAAIPVGLIAGFLLDRQFLKARFGETPSAVPVKSTGLALYIRQRNRIVNG